MFFQNSFKMKFMLYNNNNIIIINKYLRVTLIVAKIKCRMIFVRDLKVIPTPLNATVQRSCIEL